MVNYRLIANREKNRQTVETNGCLKVKALPGTQSVRFVVKSNEQFVVFACKSFTFSAYFSLRQALNIFNPQRAIIWKFKVIVKYKVSMGLEQLNPLIERTCVPDASEFFTLSFASALSAVQLVQRRSENGKRPTNSETIIPIVQSK